MTGASSSAIAQIMTRKSTHVVAFDPSVVPVVGLPATILLHQLAYLSREGPTVEGWLERTLAQLQTDTGLPEKQLRNAREILESEQLIFSKYDRADHTLAFRVNPEIASHIDTRPPAARASAQRASAHDEHMPKGQVASAQRASTTCPKGISLRKKTLKTNKDSLLFTGGADDQERTGDGAPGDSRSPVKPDSAPGFDRFWEAYPDNYTPSRRESKSKCRKIWDNDKLERHAELILMALEHFKKSDQWRRNGGQFVSSSLKWLKERKWESVKPNRMESRIPQHHDKIEDWN